MFNTPTSSGPTSGADGSDGPDPIAQETPPVPGRCTWTLFPPFSNPQPFFFQRENKATQYGQENSGNRASGSSATNHGTVSTPSYADVVCSSSVRPSSTSTSLEPQTNIFSRKVFLGGFPTHIREDLIIKVFKKFGDCEIDARSRSNLDKCIENFIFIYFKEESSVNKLLEACHIEREKHYFTVTSQAFWRRVEVKPWRLSDGEFVLDAVTPIDPSKTAFLGGIPIPLTAEKLAAFIAAMYGPVQNVLLHTDLVLKYPRGSARITFVYAHSYMAAVSSGYFQLPSGKVIQVMPYLFKARKCIVCKEEQYEGRVKDTFFCSDVVCQKYFCEQCWLRVHATPGLEHHKIQVSRAGRPPIFAPFSWY